MSIHTHDCVPAARVDGLVVTESKSEVLVYDTTQHHIHHLNQTSAVVWRLCDGRRSVADLAREAQFKVEGLVTEDSVRLALTKLEDAGLLEGPLLSGMRGARQTRRTLLKRAAVAGAVAVPAIVSISAPTAAQPRSSLGCGESCVNRNDDCNSSCSQCGVGSGTGSGVVCCNPGNNPNVLQCADLD
jgi:hypothetical protein